MRAKSKKTNGYQVYAVSGINTISFAVDYDDADTKGLLGFAVERHDKTESERYFMRGFKVFEDMIPNPDENTAVSTFEHPVQSFVWDDFTAKPAHNYTYYFYPLKGSPKNINRTTAAIKLDIQTEALFDESQQHDVFFNRGVASSQAYFRRFHNATPGSISDPTELSEVFGWLARDLQNAIIEFIDQAKKGDTLLACFYEFHYKPIVQKFKDAIDRGVNVSIIIDAKDNKEEFPKDENLKTMSAVGIPKKNIFLRKANQSSIQHNKFIVFLKGRSQAPAAVWTGSTNISEGGIFGQTNVGHWVRNERTAESYRKYWEILKQDPGGQPNESRSEKTKDNKAFKKQVVALHKDFESGALDKIPRGVTPIFSPRVGAAMLSNYAAMLDNAKDFGAITFAFGVNNVFREVLSDNNQKSQLIFMLLEKQDKPKEGAEKEFTKLRASHNIYQAWGSYIRDPLYQWTKEVNNRILGLNKHVMYIHSKFMLVDPLGDEPIIVTGSANFSKASTVSNDENMLIIKGNKRAADIYFTEFNRLFNHYYFRSVYETARKYGRSSKNNLFLASDDEWLKKYKPGGLKHKRVKILTRA